jgi:ATP-dependent protease ClpP protease subunit
MPEEKLCYQHYIDKTKQQLDIILHDVIGFEGTQSKDFMKILEDKTIKNIHIDINSLGGSVAHGISIYNALKAHPARVHVKVSGFAMSMASVVAMAGDDIEMPETTFMMIHKPLIEVMVAPNADILRKTAETLDKMEQSIIMAYKSRMDIDETEITNLLRATTWYSAAEAKEAGLADIVTEEEVKVVNFFDFSNYENVPEAVVAKYSNANTWKFCVCDDCGYSVEHTAGEPCGKCPDCETQMHGSNDDINQFLKNPLKLSKYFNSIPGNPGEEEDMDKMSELTNELMASKNENTALVDKNAALETENKALKEAQETADKKSAETSNKEFLANMVKEGRVRPKDEEFHLGNMAGKDEAGLEKYKAWLKDLPKIVDTSAEHIAKKEGAVSETGTESEEILNKRALEIVKEKGGLYSVALRQAYSEHPELKTE